MTTEQDTLQIERFYSVPLIHTIKTYRSLWRVIQDTICGHDHHPFGAYWGSIRGSNSISLRGGAARENGVCDVHLNGTWAVQKWI